MKAIQYKPLSEFPGYTINEFGCIRNPQGVVLRPFQVKGYQAVKIGQRFNRGVITLLYKAFVGPVLPHEMVGFKSSSRRIHLSNIEKRTKKKNSSTFCHKGEDNPSVRLIKEQVMTVLASPKPGRYWAGKYGVQETTISAIRNGKSWKSLGIKYPFPINKLANWAGKNNPKYKDGRRMKK